MVFICWDQEEDPSISRVYVTFGSLLMEQENQSGDKQETEKWEFIRLLKELTRIDLIIPGGKKVWDDLSKKEVSELEEKIYKIFEDKFRSQLIDEVLKEKIGKEEMFLLLTLLEQVQFPPNKEYLKQSSIWMNGVFKISSSNIFKEPNMNELLDKLKAQSDKENLKEVSEYYAKRIELTMKQINKDISEDNFYHIHGLSSSLFEFGRKIGWILHRGKDAILFITPALLLILSKCGHHINLGLQEMDTFVEKRRTNGWIDHLIKSDEYKKAELRRANRFGKKLYEHNLMIGVVKICKRNIIIKVLKYLLSFIFTHTRPIGVSCLLITFLHDKIFYHEIACKSLIDTYGKDFQDICQIDQNLVNCIELATIMREHSISSSEDILKLDKDQITNIRFWMFKNKMHDHIVSNLSDEARVAHELSESDELKLASIFDQNLKENNIFFSRDRLDKYTSAF